MTEKRYKIDLTNSPLLSYIDMVTREKYPITEDGIYSICDLLNELHEEKQAYLTEIRRLEEQEKRLYEENKRLIKMLDNVANHMQKERRDMPIDDFVEWWNNIATEGL